MQALKHRSSIQVQPLTSLKTFKKTPAKQQSANKSLEDLTAIQVQGVVSTDSLEKLYVEERQRRQGSQTIEGAHRQLDVNFVSSVYESVRLETVAPKPDRVKADIVVQETADIEEQVSQLKEKTFEKLEPQTESASSDLIQHRASSWLETVANVKEGQVELDRPQTAAVRGDIEHQKSLTVESRLALQTEQTFEKETKPSKKAETGIELMRETIQVEQQVVQNEQISAQESAKVPRSKRATFGIQTKEAVTVGLVEAGQKSQRLDQVEKPKSTKAKKSIDSMQVVQIDDLQVMEKETPKAIETRLKETAEQSIDSMTSLQINEQLPLNETVRFVETAPNQQQSVVEIDSERSLVGQGQVLLDKETEFKIKPEVGHSAEQDVELASAVSLQLTEQLDTGRHLEVKTPKSHRSSESCIQKRSKSINVHAVSVNERAEQLETQLPVENQKTVEQSIDLMTSLQINEQLALNETVNFGQTAPKQQQSIVDFDGNRALSKQNQLILEKESFFEQKALPSHTASGDVELKSSFVVEENRQLESESRFQAKQLKQRLLVESQITRKSRSLNMTQVDTSEQTQGLLAKDTRTSQAKLSFDHLSTIAIQETRPQERLERRPESARPTRRSAKQIRTQQKSRSLSVEQIQQLVGEQRLQTARPQTSAAHFDLVTGLALQQMQSTAFERETFYHSESIPMQMAVGQLSPSSSLSVIELPTLERESRLKASPSQEQAESSIIEKQNQSLNVRQAPVNESTKPLQVDVIQDVASVEFDLNTQMAIQQSAVCECESDFRVEAVESRQSNRSLFQHRSLSVASVDTLESEQQWRTQPAHVHQARMDLTRRKALCSSQEFLLDRENQLEQVRPALHKASSSVGELQPLQVQQSQSSQEAQPWQATKVEQKQILSNQQPTQLSEVDSVSIVTNFRELVPKS